MSIEPFIDPEYEKKRLEALYKYSVLDTLEEKRFDDLALLASWICKTPIALISLVDSERLFFKSAIGLKDRESPFPMAFCGHAIRQKSIFIVEDSHKDKRFFDHPLVTGEADIRFYGAAQLMTPSGYAVGTLCVIAHKPRTLTVHQQEALKILSRQIISQLELNNLAMRDQLTGLFNRRFLKTILEDYIPGTNRMDPLSLIMIDVDYFKKINDNYGHDTGDFLLKELSNFLVNEVEEGDTVCRYGGEEFIIIMPGASDQEACELAEKIRRNLKNIKWVIEGKQLTAPTFSFGIATYPAHASSSAELLKVIDAALYEAKNSGRDKIVLSKAKANTKASKDN